MNGKLRIAMVGWSNANCVRDNWATDYESVESRGFIEVLRCPGPPVVRRMGLGFSPVLRPRLGSNQKISFRANCMLDGSPGPIPGAPL